MVAIPVNPVLRRELVERMRGWRACAVLTVYLGLLALSLYLAYRSGQNSTGNLYDPTINQVASVGRGIFEWLLFLMLLLVLFLVPGQTSGAIAGERERQTLVPLQVTLLSPRSIVVGKIGAALAFLALLIVATMPLLAVCFLIGGVAMSEVLAGVVMVLFVGLIVACFSTAISTFTKRVQLATVLSYGLMLILIVGTIAVRQGVSAFDTSRGTDEANPPSWLLLPNPLALVADVVDDGSDAYNAMESPLDPMEDTLRKDEAGGEFLLGGDFGAEVAIDPNTGEPVVGDEESSFWWQSMLLLSGLAVVGVLAAGRRLRTPAASER